MGIKLEEMFSDVFVVDIRNELQEGVHWRLEQYKTKIDESGQERTLFAIGIWVGDVAMIKRENLKCVSSHQVLKSKWCPSGSYSGKHGEKHRGMFTKDRARNRSKTFPGIAKAMAEQWTKRRL